MQSKEIIKGKWKIEVFVKDLDGTYGHGVRVFYGKESVAEIGIYSKIIKKLDPYMWFECYEAFTYHKPSMDIKEWEEIIRELDAQK